MYDPARDIFTDNRPSSSPPTESYDLSALDTLAGLAAEAEAASLPVKQENDVNEPVKERVVKEIVQDVVKGNGTEDLPQKEISVEDAGGDNNVIPEGGVEVARTKKEPELSLKVTLHLKRDKDKQNRQDMQESTTEQGNNTEINSVSAKEKLLDDAKKENAVDPATKSESPQEPPKLRSPLSETPYDASPKKDDTLIHEESRNEKGDHSYPIPLSLSRLSKIPKRKAEERRDKPDREQSHSRNTDRERRTSRPSRSPPYRSPPNRPRSPVRRLSDDRYRPNPHPLIDSYRPSRDRDDHYAPPPKRPRSPSPPRQLKRPVRRDVTASDRDRERRERQQRDAERQRAELETARSRPVYETVRQHYNEREDRGREARQESRIFRLRKFNNWIKSVLIAKFIPERTEEEVDEDRGLFILDIGCGKGGDLLKWQKQPTVQAYVGVDVAEVSVMHAEQRAAELRGRRFSTRFFAMDCFVVKSSFSVLILGSHSCPISTKSPSFRRRLNAVRNALCI